MTVVSEETGRAAGAGEPSSVAKAEALAKSGAAPLVGEGSTDPGVPAPGALILVGLGLLSVGALRRLKR